MVNIRVDNKGRRSLYINGREWMCDWEHTAKAEIAMADQCFGDVLCAGYGLGIAQKRLLENPKVTSVLIVELIPCVITICKEHYGVIHGNVIIKDFFDMLEDQKYDCVIADICMDITPQYLPVYKKTKEKSLKLLKPEGLFIALGKDFFEKLMA